MPYFVISLKTYTIKTSLHIKLLLQLLVVLFLNKSSFASSNLYNSDSVHYFMSFGKYEAARSYLLPFKEKLKQYSDSNKVAYLTALGMVLPLVDEESEGFKSLQTALKIATQNKNKYLIDKVKVQFIEFYRKVKAYQDIPALLKSMLKDLPTDTILLCRFYHRAAAYYNELFNVKGQAHSECLDSSILLSRKSLAISKRNDLFEQQYTSYIELSSIYNKKSPYKSSTKSFLYIDSALATIKNKQSLAYYILLKRKAFLFLTNKVYDSSLYFAKLSAPFIDSIDYNLFKRELSQIISMSYFGLKDSLSGYRYRIKELHNILESQKATYRNELYKLTTAYKVKAKDELIAKSKAALIDVGKERNLLILIGVLLLAIAITIYIYFFKVKRKNKMLEELAKENEFLIGESNHRIKNNLQLIISLIGREVYKSSQSKSELVKISDKINAIAALHQQLYLTDKKDKVSIKNYLSSIEQNLKAGLIQESIKLTIDADDFEIPIDKAVYVGLLVTELIINSLKHAFEQSTLKTIKITAWKAEGNTIHIQYQDNGKGIEDNESPSLVNLLLKQLKASNTHINSMGYNLNLKFEI